MKESEESKLYKRQKNLIGFNTRSEFEINNDYRRIFPQFTERSSQGWTTKDPYSKLFEERIIFLGAPIDDATADDLMSQLLVLEAMDSQSEITLYINSPGGSLTSLAAIFDTMNYIGPQIQTVCLGLAASAAAVVLAAGTKGKRLALPNSKVIIHQPQSQGSGRQTATDIEIEANEMVKMREWLEQTLAELTGNPKDKISKDIEHDTWLTAPEAKEYGLIDEVLKSRKNKKTD